MRTLKVMIGGRLVEVGTNETDGGIFFRQRDGSWKQVAGNSQTPLFRDRHHLMRHLRANYTIDDKIRLVKGSANW